MLNREKEGWDGVGAVSRWLVDELGVTTGLKEVVSLSSPINLNETDYCPPSSQNGAWAPEGELGVGVEPRLPWSSEGY